MEQVSVMFLGAFLIVVGAAMWASRLGYLFFVVGVKTVVMLAIIATALVWYASNAHAAPKAQWISPISLGLADLPQMHAEHDANQVRWKKEYEGRTFIAKMRIGTIKEGDDAGTVDIGFTGSQSWLLPSVSCDGSLASDYLLGKSSGDIMLVSGIVKNEFAGMVELRDCLFDADVK
jgi:hypothetical protein